MLKFVKSLFTVFCAGILTIILLSLILLGYGLLPVHITNTDGNTDYKWPANAPWAKMTEGISFGKFDANGYNNLSVVDNPDIILLGSSHMEGTNIFSKQNVASLLNSMFKGKYQAYNLGISGHFFIKLCKYLEANIKMYDTPPKFAIMETSTLNLTHNAVNSLFEDKVEFTQSHEHGLIALLQRIPFFRTLYFQISGRGGRTIKAILSTKTK